MADGIILVYDITNRQSFENLDKWIEKIQSCSQPGSIVYIVGNKSDLHDDRVVSFVEAQVYDVKLMSTILICCNKQYYRLELHLLGTNTSKYQQRMASM